MTTTDPREWLRAAQDRADDRPWRVGAEGSEGSRVNPDTGDKWVNLRPILSVNRNGQPMDGRIAAQVVREHNTHPAIAAALLAVLKLHQEAPIWPVLDDGTVDTEDEPILLFCPECTTDSVVALVEDAEWSEDAETVEWPCDTYTAITDRLLGGTR